MKKLITFIIGIILFYSCSTNNDSNGNTIAVPITPSNLTGLPASRTQINLSWTDNSTNETGFKIERKTSSGAYTVVGTTATNINTYNDIGLTPSTTYTYRVYAYNTGGNSPNYSNVINITTPNSLVIPTITTISSSSITSTTCISGGEITSDGGASITAKGVVWSTSQNPTILLSTKTNNGTGIGTFSSTITQLIQSTTYYVRAYATNSVGTAYGNSMSFITSSASSASTTIIGTQTWMTTNLDVTTYRDGTIIPQVTDATQWANLTTGAWCYHGNTTANGTIYGKLYNWYAVAGIHDTNPNTPNKILAPTGYHIPSAAEWITLTSFLGGDSVAGGKLKSNGTTLWTSPNTGATNSSGFTGLPGAYRLNNGSFNFVIGEFGQWWSSTESSALNASSRVLYHNFGSVGSNLWNKTSGFSVRCIKD